jgi:hypothetical protein
MAAAGYRLLGFVVWRGARWYLRRRYRSARWLVRLGPPVAAAGVAAVRALARRRRR